MTVNEDMREAIAQAIFKGEWGDPESEYAEQQWAVEVRNSGDDTVWHNQADEVIKLLADPPETALDRMARELYDQMNMYDIPYEDAATLERDYHQHLAQTLLMEFIKERKDNG